MTIDIQVNGDLRLSPYRGDMRAKKRLPGSPKGQPKPAKRTVDADFPKRLEAAFAQRPGLSVPQLAREIGCTRAVLHNYLNGKNKTVEALLLFALADALGVAARWLLLGAGAMAKFEALTPDQARVLQTFSQLTNEELRDHWISQGEDLLRLQPPLFGTPADPYTGAKPPTVHEAPMKYRTEKQK